MIFHPLEDIAGESSSRLRLCHHRNQFLHALLTASPSLHDQPTMQLFNDAIMMIRDDHDDHMMMALDTYRDITSTDIYVLWSLSLKEMSPKEANIVVSRYPLPIKEI